MRFPIFPTLIVAAAIGVMITLGVWQLQRAEWKEGLIAAARQAGKAPALDYDAATPRPLPDAARSRFTCTLVGPADVRAGQNLRGEIGYHYVAPCRGRTTTMRIDLGWSKNPAVPIDQAARTYTGTTYTNGAGAIVLVADPALPGLSPSKVPTARDLPNNHLFYAFQWFFFAFAAGLIYCLALRRKNLPKPL